MIKRTSPTSEPSAPEAFINKPDRRGRTVVRELLLRRDVRMVLVAMALVGAVVLGYQRYQAQKTAGKQDSTQMSPSEVDVLVEKIARHIVVNKDERPTVATVDNPDALRTQNPIFYKDAIAGDMLVIWTDKAVLYSPSRDVVLSVIPLNYGTQTTSTATAAPAMKIEVRNGSGVVGRGTAFGDKVKSLGLDATVTGNAKGPTYAKTLIVAKSDASTNLVEQLQKLTRGTVGPLPAGESPIVGDILVIVGTEYKP